MRRLTGRARGTALAMAVTLVFGGIIPAPAYAADIYQGGASEYPLYVLNDHTPVAVRLSADTTPTGLAASTQYYVKVRFTVGTSPSTSTNRGFTWNAGSGRWVQEHEAWAEFPTITTDSEGRIPAATDTWLFAKFGDEAESGDYHLLISLSQTGVASTYNPVAPPVVTVLDAGTEASWIHNGVELTPNENTRLAVRGGPAPVSDAKTSPSPIYALWRTERNLVDDDADGTIDGPAEDWGPLDPLGSGASDFRTGAPADTVLSAFIKRSLVFGPFTTASADCDLALGASDITPPSRVEGLAAAEAPNGIDLKWDAATDAGGSGLEGYAIYRWEVPQTDVPYTPAPSRIATTAADAHSFRDDTAAVGVEYGYTVRAVDGDTNVGPRATPVTVTRPTATEVLRDWGADRYATALAISQATFADGSADTVVLATGAAFPDALAASGLAGAHGSPLLLVGSTVTQALTDEIDRLGATSVVLVGGEKAISKAVYDVLDADYDVDRVFGADRYVTAAEVAREIAALGGVDDAAYFVRGDEYADALAVSPFAYSSATPVLLVMTDGIPAATAGVVDELGVTEGWIAGGTAAVSSETADDIEDLIGSVPVRFEGADRYATAAAVAQAHVGLGKASYGYVGIATGRNFADALGGGAAAGASGGVLLLTQTDALSAPTAAALEANSAAIDEVRVFGGEAAVTAAVLDAITLLFP